MVITRRFLAVVHAKAREKPSGPCKLEPRGVRTQHKFPVERILKVRIYRTNRVPHPPAPTHRFLRNVAGVKQCSLAMRRQDGSTNFQTIAVNKNAMPVDNIDIRSRVKKVGNISYCTGQQDIVAVQVAHDFAIGTLETEVDRI